jgi:hypothetical protein
VTASVFAELVVTYSSSEDGRSEYDIDENDDGTRAANSVIENGDFTYWGMGLGPSDPWVFWRDSTAGWTAGRLHEFDLSHPANQEGVSNAMGWFIQHAGASSGGYYAGAYQQLMSIPVPGYYFVSVSTTAWEGGNTGPYNSIAWYAISDSADPAAVTAEQWKELFPDEFVCATGDGRCNYVGRDETVWINPGQYFHITVGRKFPEFFGHTMFVVDDISIVAADGTLDTENGFYNWCDGRPEDFKVHSGTCNNLTEVRWDPREIR